MSMIPGRPVVNKLTIQLILLALVVADLSVRRPPASKEISDVTLSAVFRLTKSILHYDASLISRSVYTFSSGPKLLIFSTTQISLFRRTLLLAHCSVDRLELLRRA